MRLTTTAYFGSSHKREAKTSNRCCAVCFLFCCAGRTGPLAAFLNKIHPKQKKAVSRPSSDSHSSQRSVSTGSLPCFAFVCFACCFCVQFGGWLRQTGGLLVSFRCARLMYLSRASTTRTAVFTFVFSRFMLLFSLSLCLSSPP